jgi:hypothetical protein
MNMRHRPLPIPAVPSGPVRKGGGAPFALWLMGLVRQARLRRVMLALLLVLGTSLTLLQACQEDGRPAEQAQVQCLEEGDALPAALVFHAWDEGEAGQDRPVEVLLRMPLERAVEPLRMPPRRG